MPSMNRRRAPLVLHQAKTTCRLIKYVCPKCGQILRIAGPVGVITCTATRRSKANPRTYHDTPQPCGGVYVLGQEGGR
jgi:hypothetical protein